MSAHLVCTEELRGIVDNLKANGCEVHLSKIAGTVHVMDDGYNVLRGIQKGKGQPWIVRFLESPRIKWVEPERDAAWGEEPNRPR